jgi:hypothetical protein
MRANFKIQYVATYLLLDSDVLNKLEDNLAKLLAVMCITDSCEAEETAFELQMGGRYLLDPVPCHGKIPISVASLPGVASQIVLCFVLEADLE